MPNQRLLDWIKEGEEKGYSEQQLIAVLSRRKVPLKDIEEAISTAHMQNSGWRWIIELFAPFPRSFLAVGALLAIFCAYQFLGIFLREFEVKYTLLFFCLYFSLYLIKANWKIKTAIIALLIFLEIEYAYSFAGLFFFLLSGAIPLYRYLRSGRLYRLGSLHFIQVLSACLGIAALIVSVSLYIWVVLPLMGELSLFVTHVLLSPCYAVAVFVQVYAQKFMMRAAYFENGELKSLRKNRNDVRERVLREYAYRPVTPRATILSFLLIACALITHFSIMYLTIGILETEQDSSEKWSRDQIKKVVAGSYFRQEFEWEEYDLVHSYLIEYYPPTSHAPVPYGFDEFRFNHLIYNCNLAAQCKKRDFTSSVTWRHISFPDSYLSEFFAGERPALFMFLRKNAEFTLFIDTLERDWKEYPYWIDVQKELRQKKVALDLNERMYQAYMSFEKEPIARASSFRERVSLIVNGRGVERIYSTTFEDFLSAGIVEEDVSSMRREWEWMTHTKNNGTPFYDGSQTLEEHAQLLNSSVEFLRTRPLKIVDDYDVSLLTVLGEEGDEKYFASRIDKIVYSTREMVYLKNLGDAMSVERNTDRIVLSRYPFRPVEGEELAETVLRLKIEEQNLLKDAVIGCRRCEYMDDENPYTSYMCEDDAPCKKILFDKVKQEEMCDLFIGDERSNCRAIMRD